MTTAYATRPARRPRVDRPASDATMKYLNDLRVQRGMGAYAGPALVQSEASRMIDTTRALPIVRAQRPVVANAPAMPDVPAGRYAFTAEDGHTAFAQIDRPSRGRYAGRVFVSLLIGAPLDWRQQRLSHDAQRTIADKIVAYGVEASMARYGHEHGRCGACESPLSDPESIARGIGPVCARRRGW